MIDPRAIIDPTAKLGERVSVGPFSIIEANVEIGDDSWIGPHVVIRRNTRIGKNNKIYQFSSIGEEPQDLRYQGEETYLELGDRNIIRENCTLHRGSVHGGGITRIGNDNFFLAYVHIAHDCQVGSHTIMANCANLAGHAKVDDYAILGAFTGVHQFCTIGKHSFVSRACLVAKDILPYVLAAGHKAKVYGINKVGLRRRGFSEQKLLYLRRAFKIICRQGLTVEQAIKKLEEMVPYCSEVQDMIDSLQSSERGVLR